jgi:hypothetical protein
MQREALHRRMIGEGLATADLARGAETVRRLLQVSILIGPLMTSTASRPAA